MLQQNPYLSKHLCYLKQLETNSVEQLIFKVLDLDQDEQQLLEKMRKQSGSKSCRQQIMPKEYCIKCYDCGVYENHLFCQSCFDENLHQNHYIKLLRNDQGTGYCDCGDSYFIKAEAFCKSHSNYAIEEKLSDQEKHLIEKIKILLEISCYNALRFLEYSAKLPIIQADDDLIQNSQFLKESLKLKQIAYYAYEKMSQITLYLTGSNPNLIEMVSEVFTSQVPLGLQYIEQFQHNHQPMFNLGQVLEQNKNQLCQCSVLKNLIRYMIFLNREYKQELYIRQYLPHLLIDRYAKIITRTFIEMIPFQMQIFTKVKFHCKDINKQLIIYVPFNFNEEQNDCFQLQEINDLNCIQTSNKEVQLISEIFEVFFQLEKNFIQQFQFHKEQIEYVGWFIQQGTLKSKRLKNILYKFRFQLFGQLTKSQSQYCIDEFLINDPINSFTFRTIINLIPCRPYQKHQNFKLKYQDKDITKLILNQHYIIIIFDQIFKNLILNCVSINQKLQITQIMFQYLLQKMIQQYPMNYQNQFKLQKLQFIFAQFVPADHIMIILVSFFCQLRQVQTGDQLIKIMIEEFQISKHQLEQQFTNLAQRAIQNLVLFNDTYYYIYYCRKLSKFPLNDKVSEFSSESLDRSIVQMYLFLYGEKAIVAAYIYVEYINKHFQTNFDRDRFLNTAFTSDFDMYQTCSHYFKDELPQDFKAALRKLLRSLYYAQNYFSYNQILDNFNQMGNNQPNINQNNLLEILELDPYSGQLRLKKEFQSPLFEPLYFRNQAIFKQIQDKLSESNNQEVNIFGNSIDFDFLCTDKNQKTLSSIRKHIIDQLLLEDNIMAIILLDKLNSQTDENIKWNIIKSNKQLVYLIIVASRHLKLPWCNQQVLQQLFDIIQQFTIKNDIIEIFKQKIIGNKQIGEVKQPNNNNNQKLHLMKKKFQQKQQQFENYVLQDANIIKDEYDPNFICNLCVQQMDKKLDDAYQLALLQLNNNILHCSSFKDLSYLQFLFKFSPSSSEITLSGCSHIFHFKCIKKLNVIKVYDEYFYECIICKSFGNKIFSFNSINSQQIFQDLEYFTLISRTDMLEYYYQTYNINGELDIKSANAEIILQIYLHYIRQIIGNTNFYDCQDNIKKFKQLSLLIKEQIDKQISDQYFIIINKYSKSVIFQILQQILHHSFNIETQQFSQNLLQILDNFELFDQYNQDIFKKLFNHQPEIQQSENLRSLIIQKVEQYTNLRDLQKRLIEKCIHCHKFSQYICLGCNQKICNNLQVILDYRKSCCYRHSLKCHNGKVNILDAQNGLGFVSYQSEIILYHKSLFKSKLGQMYEGDFLNSSSYQVDPIAFQEFYHIQIQDKQMTYIIRNKK